MQCKILTVATLAMLWETRANKIKDETNNPSDHVLQNFIEDSLKNLLHIISQDKNVTTKHAERTYAETTTEVNEEERKQVVIDNLHKCFRETILPEDLGCLHAYWKPNTEFPHLKELLDTIEVNKIPGIPECVKYCMMWARGGIVTFSWQARRAIKAKHAFESKKYNENSETPEATLESPYFIYIESQQSPHYRYEKTFPVQYTSQEGNSELEAEASAVCARLAVSTLDSCFQDIVDIDDLELLRSYWTPKNTKLMIKLFESPAFNEFEDIPKEIKNCLVQAKEDFTKCTIDINIEKPVKLIAYSETE